MLLTKGAILVLFFLSIFSISIQAQIGFCWKGTTPPYEVGDAAPTPVNEHSTSSLPTIVNNAEIHVYGEFDLDINNAEFNGCEFVLYQGAILFIEDNVTVSFNGTSFEGCFVMWDRIHVRPSAGIIMQNCMISDAENAVRLLPGSVGSFFNNTFDRNWIGINAPNGDFVDNVWNNNFTCSSPLYSPRAGQDSWAGINVNLNIIDVTFFIGGNSTFDGLQNGIIALQSIVTCNQCVFSNIYQNPSLPGGVGFGIDATVNSQILVENSTFSDVHTGVRLNQSTLNMNNSTLTKNHRGVFTNAFSDPHFITVFENEFVECDRAVQIAKQGSGVVDIRDNSISADQPGFNLIQVFSDPVSTDQVRINNNTISSDSVEATAIATWQTNDVEINGNVIDFSTGSGAFSGIRVFMCEDATVSNNDLYGVVNQGGNTSGISIHTSPNSDICCNEVKEFGRGFTFFGDCNLSDYTQNTMESNGTALLLRQTQNANTFIGPQAFAGNEWLNFSSVINARNEGDVLLSRFDVNDASLPVHPVSVDPLGIWFFVDQFGSHANCESSPNCGQGGGDPISPGDGEAIAENSTLGDGVAWSIQMRLKDRIDNDPSLLGQNPDVDEWYAKQSGSELESLLKIQNRMLDELKMVLRDKEDLESIVDAVLSSKSDQSRWFDEYQNGRISLQDLIIESRLEQGKIDKKLITRKDLIERIKNDLKSNAREIRTELANLSLSGTLALEQQSIVDLLLDYYQDKAGFNSTKINELDGLSRLCVFEYGRAILWARAAMYSIEGSVYDDEEGCPKGLKNPIKGPHPSLDQAVIFPNPAHDVLYLDQQYDEVQIHDLNNKVVLSKKSLSEVNISRLNPGIYLVKLTLPNADSQTMRIIKQ